MRKLLYIYLFFAFQVHAQMIIRPGVWQNAFQIEYAQGKYSYGGKFGNTVISPTLDLEFVFASKPDSLKSLMQLSTNPRFSILLSINYWNHNNTEHGYNNNGDILFSSYKTKYMSLPLLAKYYMQLGVLDENLRIGWGLGVMGLYALSTQLHEEATVFIRDQNNAIVSEQNLQDTKDLTTGNKRFLLPFCLELSVSYRRFYFSLRAWQAGQNQYNKTIESNWNLSKQQSIYLQANQQFPKMTLTGGGLMLGWQINRIKRK